MLGWTYDLHLVTKPKKLLELGGSDLFKELDQCGNVLGINWVDGAHSISVLFDLVKLGRCLILLDQGGYPVVFSLEVSDLLKAVEVWRSSQEQAGMPWQQIVERLTMLGKTDVVLVEVWDRS